MARYTNLLVEQIKRRAIKGEPVNVADWVAFYSFDVMGALAYSESFGLLERGVPDYYLKTTREGLAVLGLLSFMPWLIPLFRALPIVSEADARLWRFLIGRTEERISLEEGEAKGPPDGPDVFSWILKSYRQGTGRKWMSKTNLYSDAYLITIAGRYVCNLECIFISLLTPFI